MTFNTKSQILAVRFAGHVSLDDFRDYVVKLNDLHDLPKTLNILHDFTRAEQSVQPGQIRMVFDILRLSASSFDKIRVASVHDKPITTAVSTLFRERMPYTNVEFRLFSTMEVAFAWLSIGSARDSESHESHSGGQIIL
ncbi:MAG: STAS/SEC14 domain-containing protein [Bacteroidales bacterium]|nr:STAS/SEC14 domain-containing protein [Bacteroidales bacterium]